MDDEFIQSASGYEHWVVTRLAGKDAKWPGIATFVTSTSYYRTRILEKRVIVLAVEGLMIVEMILVRNDSVHCEVVVVKDDINMKPVKTFTPSS